MKKSLYVLVSFIFFITNVVANIDTNNLVWQSITFGQSVDLNFGSTILPEKVGTNQVIANNKVVKSGKIASSFTIESRGGKLANSHDGLTFYYTVIPTSKNFILSADVELHQLGPETGATPNFQEGAGIMVRDIIGEPRMNPQPKGHEEFPSASNMVSNTIVAKSRTNDGKIKLNGDFRQGVYHPWGTKGNKRTRATYVNDIDYIKNNKFSLTLIRNNNGYKVIFDNGDIRESKDLKAPANIVEMQDNKNQYIGFFASRNAKVTFSNVKLTLSNAKKDNTPRYVVKKEELVVQDNSSNRSAVDEYYIISRANYSGIYKVYDESSKVLTNSKEVKAGKYFTFKTILKADKTKFKISFTPSDKALKSFSYEKKVERVNISDPYNIYVSAKGNRKKGDGSEANPIDLQSALDIVAQGGTIYLKKGKYKGITLSSQVSGLSNKRKKLKGLGDKVVFTSDFIHDASFWDISNIEVAKARLIVYGSHNNFSNIVTHGAIDTGFQITSLAKVGRALWASYNIVLDSESYNNMDPSQINADGFAAKIRVGDGNTFIRCIAYHNADDGWDLFNKVEDGPNGVVSIIDSIAFKNGETFKSKNKSATIGNGFKLGGEGIPVSHIVKNNLAFLNNMDGFTDNFNPGTLVLENNIAIDNRRFNYIFRKSPYSGSIKQGIFKNNLSVRKNVESQYYDVINASYKINNQFILGDDSNYEVIDNKEVETILAKKRITKEDALKLQEILFNKESIK